MANKRSVLVKDSLRKQLNTTVMEVRCLEHVTKNGGTPVGDCEEVMALCAVLEAIFLHGLKDSLLNRVTEALSGPDFDAMPQPSFWGPLLVFSHRQIINQIQGLKQIKTEVGFCRAWIRLALNEGLLSSYFGAIQRDNSSLKPYYDQTAFIRDSDYMEVAKRLIESLDIIVFNIACNSSLLNSWSSTPLLMAAIWTPPMKSCPVVSAVDIAKTISSEVTENENIEESVAASPIGSVGSHTSTSVRNHIGAFSEDDALKIILAGGISNPLNHPTRAINIEDKTRKNKRKDRKKSSKNRTDDDKVELSDKNNVNEMENVPGGSAELNGTTSNIEEGASALAGNSLIGKLGWSTSVEDCDSSNASSSDAPKTPCEAPTFDALLKSYNPGGYAASPNLKDFLDKYAPKSITEKKTEPEKCKKPIKIHSLDELIGKLPREQGLDSQNYSCFECRHPVGMTFSKAHVCAFSGNYFCGQCMSTEEYSIPSRIIHNWDLKPYPVSQKAAAYLTGCTTLLDLKILNPRIYMAVDTMAQLQTLRIQLNLLRAYLFTCREPVIESLQKKVTPREYLYEHVHQYSVADLLDIPSGTLAQQLQKIVTFARDHVLNCWLCSQKGFICEVCNNPKVIYPFDMDSTYRCNGCSAVFHANCLNSQKPCPKCERKRIHLSRLQLDTACNTNSVVCNN
uniref:RUN domain-containing protein n=1 Tax=Bracon brevicornis TaxID=1563983 RepID=A0A6V7I186_9HYME